MVEYKEHMKILSLFDGISCARLALGNAFNVDVVAHILRNIK